MGPRSVVGMVTLGNPKPKRLVLVILMVALLAAPVAMAAGPTLEVKSPKNGDEFATKHVVVEGCATAPLHALTLGVSKLGTETGSGLVPYAGALRLRPVKYFSDDFDGDSLNTTNWVIVRNSGNLTVSGGELLMFSADYVTYKPPGLIKSTHDVFPTGTDYNAEIKVKYDYPGYTGTGGGITHSEANLTYSTSGFYNWYNLSQQYIYVVYANGKAVHNDTYDYTSHVFRLHYTFSTDRYELLMDDNSLAKFATSSRPELFWFGCVDDSIAYYGSYMRVDYTDIWSNTGGWTSQPYDMGHASSVESVRAVWTSTDMAKATLSWEARFSPDNDTWSAWTPYSGTGSGTPVSARWVQFRVSASLPVKSESANITLSSFELTYRDPLTSVEVRRLGGDWKAATGLETWSAALDLEEDANTIEVRAIDTSGAQNETSLAVIVDTTPPVGSMEISGGQRYTNNLNVTLNLTASDKYGVQYVQVSSAPDMFNKRTYPFAPKLSWRLEGTDGEIFVYARFVDAHGLLSSIYGDSVNYHAIPPTGTVKINGEAQYTPSTTVSLVLEYGDTRGVTKVELSNDAGFTAPTTVEVGTRAIDHWTLAPGGDGPRTVYMRLTDVANNTAVVSSSIVLYVPKAVGSVTIEGGASVTSKSIVSLLIEAPLESHASRMQVSNDLSFTDVTWESYAKDKLWFLPEGDGVKHVFVRFEDFRNIVSLPVNGSIVLDTTPPDITVALEGGAKYTTATNITASISYSDASAATRMWVAHDERLDLAQPQPFNETIPWTINAWEGDQYIYVKVGDLAGNTAVASTSIHFSTVKPKLTLELPGGAVAGTASTIAVKASATDPYGGVEVQLAFNEDPPEGTTWLAVNGSLSVDVPARTPDGNYEVRGRARNIAGLVSDIFAIPVRIDRTPPKVEITGPADNATLSQGGLDVLLEFTAQDENGIANVSYKADGGGWVFLPVDGRSAVVALKGFGQHAFVVRAVDAAGNPATTTTTFRLDKSSATVASGSLIAIAVFAVLLVVIVLVAVMMVMSRRRAAARTRPVQKGQVKPPAPPAMPVRPAEAPPAIATGAPVSKAPPSAGQPSTSSQPPATPHGGKDTKSGQPDWEEF